MPRPYQSEAIDAAYLHLCTKDNNPCVVLPTGAGKSPVIAWMIQRFKADHPPFRCIVLAHVKELVRQNADKMLQVWPTAPIGIYAAGLRQRQVTKDITFASIDSVYSKAYDFDAFDLIVVDEAHRIPVRGEGKYRQFIADAQRANPRVRVVGMTATPYRLGAGDICHKDHILNEVCYESNVRDLIESGYLCRLRSKNAVAMPDLAGVKIRNGDYVTSGLSDAVDPVVPAAVKEAVGFINAENRQGVIFFCVDVNHCHHVSNELRRYGIDAPAVTGKTPRAERDRIAERFIDGHLRAICNVNVYTEGFDATRVDAVALMRPTESQGLFYQMVGRGLRLDPRKPDCLILDFAGCIDRHGPIDTLASEGVRMVTCESCRETFSRAVNECPQCGWEVPKIELPDDAGEADAERGRKMHERKASERNILSSTEPEVLAVDGVAINRHRKPGSPDSLRVTYRVGISTFREWICLDHDGFAGRKAKSWWRRRFGGDDVPSVDDAVSDMFLAGKLDEITESISVIQKGKYPEIVNVAIGRKAGAA